MGSASSLEDNPPRCTLHRRTPMVGCLPMPREPSRRGIQWGRFWEVSLWWIVHCSGGLFNIVQHCSILFNWTLAFMHTFGNFFRLTLPFHSPVPQWLETAAKRRKICCEKPMRKCITAWASVFTLADIKGMEKKMQTVDPKRWNPIFPPTGTWVNGI